MKGDSEGSANQHVGRFASSSVVANSRPTDAGEGFKQKRYGVVMEFCVKAQALRV